MPKRKHVRQRPPVKSQTRRAKTPKKLSVLADIPMPPVDASGRIKFPVKLPKKAPASAPRKGHLPLTAFEAAMFMEMMAEARELQKEQADLTQRDRALRQRHNAALEGLSKTHELPIRISVELNAKATALKWTEVKDDSPEGDSAGAGPEAPPQGD